MNERKVHQKHRTHQTRATDPQRHHLQEQPGHELYRDRQEHRLIHKEHKRLRQQQNQGFSHPELLVAPQIVCNPQYREPPKHTKRYCTCERLTSDEESMLDMDEMRFNEMILQTFEEMENVFSFPLTSQREARAFTKVLRSKGLTPKLIGGCIGESEQDLTAWQGGQSNHQIGRMLIARINLPLVELLSSDEEDESDAPKELAKQNTAKHGAAKTKKDPVHLLAGDKKQQQATDLTSSWLKQIETKMATVEAEPNGVDWGDNDGDNEPQADSAGEMPTEERNRQIHKGESPSHEVPTLGLHRESVAYEVVQNAKRVTTRTEKHTHKEKEPHAAPQLNHHSGQDLPDSNRDTVERGARNNKEVVLTPSESSTDAPSDMSEVVEEPISKAVALENFACMLNQNMTLTDMSAATDTSAASIVTETVVPQVAEESTARQFLLETNGSSVRSASSVSQPPAEESNNEHYQIEVNENYDSDLDINNGDASTQAVMIRKNLRVLKTRMDDGTGYLYVFSDNSGKSSGHRIKVGSSRFPAKRLEQASMFNLDIQLVSAISVNMRKSALQDALKALRHYQLRNTTSWFDGPLPKILDIVAGVAAKFPLQTSSFA